MNKGDRMKKLILAGFLVTGVMANDDYNEKRGESLWFAFGYKVNECIVKKFIGLPEDEELINKLGQMFERECKNQLIMESNDSETELLVAYDKKRGREASVKAYNEGREAFITQHKHLIK